MSSDNEKFSRMGFCCIVDKSKRIAWSNDKYLFKKIISSKRFSSVLSAASVSHTPFEYRTTFEGIRFRINFLPIPENLFLGVAYPEECYIRYAYSEMYMRVFNIKRNATRTAASLSVLKDKLRELDVPDEIMDLIDEQFDYAGEILNDSRSVTNLFDSEHMFEYVNISENLSHTESIINKYNAILNRELKLDIELENSVARLNYNVFEAILLQLARIIYKYTDKEDCTLMKISGKNTGSLRVRIDLDRKNGFDTGSIDNEVRDIKCAAQCLGGSSRLYFTEDKFVLEVNIPAHLSNYLRRVRSDVFVAGKLDESYYELKGYSRLVEPVDPKRPGILRFRNNAVVIKVDISYLMADIMFCSLIPGFERFTD